MTRGGADGGCAARRIAARLIAKHSNAVPAKLGETLSKLVKLSAYEPRLASRRWLRLPRGVTRCRAWGAYAALHRRMAPVTW